MKKIVAKTVLWLLGIFAVLFFAFPYLMSWQLSASYGKTWDSMNKTELACPEGYEVTNRGWSKAGYMRYCEPFKHGPWEAWSDGYLQVKGKYKHGKKDGAWQWFNKDGSIQTIITYNNGVEVEVH